MGQRSSSRAVKIITAPSSFVVLVQGTWKERLVELSRLVRLVMVVERVTWNLGSKARLDGTVSSPRLGEER